MLDAGLIDEVRGLLAAGCSPASSAMTSIGYREAVAHLRGELSLEQALQAMQRSTRRFAKRQLTWFRADPTIRWLDGETAELDDLLAAAAP
jgi:tRNA dimethylallyltransferase